MSKKQMLSLVDKDAIGTLFGCFLKDLRLVTEYPLVEEDLANSSFINIYKGIMVISESFEAISAEELVLFLLKIYPSDPFISSKAEEWLSFHRTIADTNLSGYYYNIVKKYALMRDLEREGFKTQLLIDYEKIDLDGSLDKQKEKFNGMTIEEILMFFRERQSGLEEKYSKIVKQTVATVGEGLRSLKERLKEVPELGLAFQGDIYSTVARGARRSKYFIRSAASGIGKTRTMVGDCCEIGIPYKYNWEIKDWEFSGQAKPCGFFTTELEFDEIQTMVIANISGVNEDNIINGDYESEEQEKIVDEAILIIENYSKIVIEYMPDPSIGLLKNKIKQMVEKFKVEYIWFDYIHTTPSLLNEFRDLKVREDSMLMLFSSLLKQTANDLGVHISTATQLNAEGNEAGGFKGVNSIRGAKSIK